MATLFVFTEWKGLQELGWFLVCLGYFVAFALATMMAYVSVNGESQHQQRVGLNSKMSHTTSKYETDKQSGWTWLDVESWVMMVIGFSFFAEFIARHENHAPTLSAKQMEQQLMEQQLTEQQLMEQPLTEQQLMGQQLMKQQLTEQQLTEQQLMEQQLTEQQLTEQQLMGQQLMKQQLTERQLMEQQLWNMWLLPYMGFVMATVGLRLATRRRIRRNAKASQMYGIGMDRLICGVFVCMVALFFSIFTAEVFWTQIASVGEFLFALGYIQAFIMAPVNALVPADDDNKGAPERRR